MQKRKAGGVRREEGRGGERVWASGGGGGAAEGPTVVGSFAERLSFLPLFPSTPTATFAELTCWFSLRSTGLISLQNQCFQIWTQSMGVAFSYVWTSKFELLVSY